LIDSRIASRGFSGSGYRSAAATAAIVYSKHLFWWEGYSPPQKTFHFIPQLAAKLCAVNLFAAGAVNHKYTTETFF